MVPTITGLMSLLQDRYRELMRAGRQWMDIELRLRNGEGHNGSKAGQAGSLALQCFSCPQPGFNLPDDWKTLQLYVWTVWEEHTTHCTSQTIVALQACAVHGWQLPCREDVHEEGIQ